MYYHLMHDQRTRLCESGMRTIEAYIGFYISMTVLYNTVVIGTGITLLLFLFLINWSAWPSKGSFAFQTLIYIFKGAYSSPDLRERVSRNSINKS